MSSRITSSRVSSRPARAGSAARGLAFVPSATPLHDPVAPDPVEPPRDTLETPSRILVAEDDHRVRNPLSQALRQHGYLVIEARDGREAIDKARELSPHLAIVDLRMPEVDGFEVIRALKQDGSPEMFVMVLSALDREPDRIRAFELGAEDFVAKPVTIPELIKRVEAFERTRRAIADAKQANERADRLRLFAAEAAALLAHDLLNGLSVAIPNLEFLRDGEQPLDGEVAEAVDQTLHHLLRMKGLVRNFADISLLEDAQLAPERRRVDIAGLLHSTAFIHSPRTAAGEHVIQVDVPDGLIARVDPVLIERVIHNLLNNAVRYVDRDRGHIVVRGAIEDSDAGPELVISVGNVGSPIPPAMRVDLFDKYRRGHDGRAQRGMGLYFCRLACEAHGGTIALEESEEFPTYFVIRVPA